MNTREPIVFGKWLILTRHLEPRILESALAIQQSERSVTLRSSPRLLGQILLEDFNVFRSRVDLNKALIEFNNIKNEAIHRMTHNSPEKDLSKTSGSTKSSKRSSRVLVDRTWFGQFLIKKKKVDPGILASALAIQDREITESMRRSHRLLGEILMDDFHAFSSRVELNRLLIEYNQYKIDKENQRTDLIIYRGKMAKS